MALKTQQMQTDLQKYRKNYDDIFNRVVKPVRGCAYGSCSIEDCKAHTECNLECLECLEKE